MAAAALALAGYAIWVTLRHDASSPAKRADRVAPKPAPPRRSRPKPAQPPPPAKRPFTRPQPRSAVTEPNADADTGAPAKAPFDDPLERFDMAAKMLHDEGPEGPNRAALLHQATMAITDMRALLDPAIPTQMGELTRATQALGELEARYGP